MHSMYAVADIGNGKELLKLYVEELNNPNSKNDIYRSYMLQNIEKQQSGVKGSQNNSVSPITQTVAVRTIADLYDIVKSKDKNTILCSRFFGSPVSKLLAVKYAENKLGNYI